MDNSPFCDTKVANSHDCRVTLTADSFAVMETDARLAHVTNHNLCLAPNRICAPFLKTNKKQTINSRRMCSQLSIFPLQPVLYEVLPALLQQVAQHRLLTGAQASNEIPRALALLALRPGPLKASREGSDTTKLQGKSIDVGYVCIILIYIYMCI